jgi:hypothetical protein
VNEWEKKLFYLKTDLTARAKISGIIHSPIVTSFGFKKPTGYVGFEARAAIAPFNAISTHIGTRDLVLEFLAFKTWPLVAEWDMPKVSEGDASDAEPRLVRLRYKYRFDDEFGEPSDGWLDYVEARCNEILGNYSKSEVEALQQALNARKRSRLNRVFDAIEFFYPNYPVMV